MYKRDHGISVGNYILFAALNRCLKPKSKTQLLYWFDNSIYPNYFPSIDSYFDAKAYSNHFKYLTPEVIKNIENQIQNRLIQHLQVKIDTIFYDPTNFYTYINPSEIQILPKHGHSKENRFTLNLIGLALFCTHDGEFPFFHEMYPRNYQDASLFRSQISVFLNRLKEMNKDPSSLTLVFDKGNLSEQAFHEIDKMNLNFIASVRPSTLKKYKHLSKNDFEMFILPNQKKVGILEFSEQMYGRNRRLIIIYNPISSEWQKNNLVRKLEKKINEINDFFQNRLNIKKWRDINAVKSKIESIIKIKAYFQWISYNVFENKGKIKYSIKLDKPALEKHLQTFGKSFLISNHPQYSAHEIVWLYRQQYTVENAFKYLKCPSLFPVRPIYHRNDSSIRGHLFSCVIGLLLVLLLLRKINQKFPKISLCNMYEYLSEIKVSEISFKNSNKTIHLLNKMSTNAKNRHKFLELKI
ncbi:IS1634 family transposase [Candidatus Harpocratesius sp.]